MNNVYPYIELSDQKKRKEKVFIRLTNKQTNRSIFFIIFFSHTHTQTKYSFIISSQNRSISIQSIVKLMYDGMLQEVLILSFRLLLSSCSAAFLPILFSLSQIDSSTERIIHN